MEAISGLRHLEIAKSEVGISMRAYPQEVYNLEKDIDMKMSDYDAMESVHYRTQR